jgi:hypothetical protein
MVAITLSGEQQAPMGPVPKGDYKMALVGSKQKTSKTNNQYLELTFEIIAGDCKGRKVWDNLNLWHTNVDAQSFAKDRLAGLIYACGLPGINDTDELLHKEFVGSVDLDTSGDKDRNTMAGFKRDMTGVNPPPQGFGQQQQQQSPQQMSQAHAQQVTSGGAPWQ